VSQIFLPSQDGKNFSSSTYEFQRKIGLKRFLRLGSVKIKSDIYFLGINSGAVPTFINTNSTLNPAKKISVSFADMFKIFSC